MLRNRVTEPRQVIDTIHIQEVELDGADHVSRLRQRMAGDDEFDPSRGIDFLVHSRAAHRPRTCPMATHRLALIDSARTSLTVEMAYLGDIRFTRALARAVNRGVALTLVTAERADVLGNVNRATCDTLRRLTELRGALGLLDVPVVYVMTDFAARTIEHWRSHRGLAPFVAAGQLDFAAFDVAAWRWVDAWLPEEGVRDQGHVRTPMGVARCAGRSESRGSVAQPSQRSSVAFIATITPSGPTEWYPQGAWSYRSWRLAVASASWT